MTPAEQTRAIIAQVAAEHKVTVDDILGPSRKKHIVRARDEAIAWVKVARPNLSWPQMGKLFNRNHTSILAAMNRPKWRAKNKRYDRARAERVCA